MPPPKPCKPRAAISIGMLPAKPHKMEAATNITTEATTKRLRPK